MYPRRFYHQHSLAVFHTVRLCSCADACPHAAATEVLCFRLPLLALSGLDLTRSLCQACLVRCSGVWCRHTGRYAKNCLGSGLLLRKRSQNFVLQSPAFVREGRNCVSLLSRSCDVEIGSSRDALCLLRLACYGLPTQASVLVGLRQIVRLVD